MTDYEKIARPFYAGIKDALRDNIQEQVAPINAKLDAVSKKLRDIYKADVYYLAESTSSGQPTIYISFESDAQYLYISRSIDAETLLNIPVELIVQRLVADIDDSILKMYKK